MAWARRKQTSGTSQKSRKRQFAGLPLSGQERPLEVRVRISPTRLVAGEGADYDKGRRRF